jgi:H+-transporting ATPase
MEQVSITAEQAKQLDVKDLYQKLDADPAGLESAEAARRLTTHGFNELAEKKTNPVLKFFSYFWGPIPWMIEAAVILSGVVGHWADLGIISALLLMNAVVGFWEEYKADSTIAALKKRLALEAKVRRDGKWTIVPARELVPGDVIRLGIGEIVPADAKLLDGDPLQVDQSALTGESLPVTAGPGDTVYSGSIVNQGEIEALVYATGTGTFFGRTAQLVESTRTRSHFQKAVLKIGDYLIVIALALVILILAVALFRGDSILTALQFSLILTVAAIPVAMPAVLSVTMAVGAGVLAKKEAIVSRLAAVEEMAGMDVLCSDKTGTLTQNKLTRGDPFTLAGVGRDELLLAAALASRADTKDPIDRAITGGLDHPPDPAEFEVVHFQPFDPVNKRTEAQIRASDGREFLASKGAPQVILTLVQAGDEIRSQVDEAVGRFARRGFRSLGIARKDGLEPWRFLGVIPLFDPPRQDSKETIATAKTMGIDIKMVTGDQVAIAKEIAGQLDLGTNILDADRLAEAGQHETGQMAQAIEQSSGFAQVFPEHKYHIVDVLQQRDHIVGMTGDGVNDAPALKKADAGIAVSGATDAAQAAADIVLITPGLSVIIDAVKESRKIFQRMTNYAMYRIAETIRVLLFMTLSILIFNFYPVTAVMIVLLALLNDGPILAIAFDRTKYSDRPERWNMPQVIGMASVLGVIGVVASFGLFYLGERVFNLSREVIQTLMFLKLTVAGHLTIFITRTRGPFWSIAPGRALLWSAVATKVLATLAAVYGIFMVPIGWWWALLVWGYSLVWFLVNDWIKMGAYRVFDRAHSGWLARRQPDEG